MPRRTPVRIVSTSLGSIARRAKRPSARCSKASPRRHARPARPHWMQPANKTDASSRFLLAEGAMSKLHLVFGGRVKDPRGLDFVDLDHIDLVGIYDSFAAAEDAWRGKAQGSVDDAEMKYVIVHLHRLLEPDLEGSIPGIARPRASAES